MGHTICASGVVDAVLTTFALGEKCVPGIANLDSVAETCKTLNAARESRPLAADKSHAMVINRGYGSINACLVIKRCDA